MSKLIGELVRPHIDQDSKLSAFIWRKRPYEVVEILSHWWEPSEWWNGKAMRFFVRVKARKSSEGIYELYRLEDNWFLYKVLD